MATLSSSSQRWREITSRSERISSDVGRIRTIASTKTVESLLELVFKDLLVFLVRSIIQVTSGLCDAFSRLIKLLTRL